MTRVLSAAALASAAEASVVALARSGDRNAFEELVRRRQTHVRNLFRRLCRDSVLADDLAQETFFQSWKQIASLRSVGAFGGWLRQVSVNVWLQHSRRAEKFSELNDDDRIADAAPSIGLDLDAALNSLPSAMRLCVVLAYHEGMSHGEIEAATRIPLGTVKSNIARGAERLRLLLAEYNRPTERRVHV